MVSRFVRFAAIAVSAATLAASAKADTVGFDPSTGVVQPSFNTIGNDGLFFTVGNSPVLVTALGYFHDGAAHTNAVGIYRVSDGALLGSTNVTTTATVAPVPSWDYSSISILLAPNTSYALVGAEGYDQNSQITEQYNVNAADMGTAVGISYDGYKYDYNPGLDLPTLGFEPAYIGPNMKIEIVPLPAAAYAGLGSLACVAGLGVVRRRRLRAF